MNNERKYVCVWADSNYSFSWFFFLLLLLLVHHHRVLFFLVSLSAIGLNKLQSQSKRIGKKWNPSNQLHQLSIGACATGKHYKKAKVCVLTKNLHVSFQHDTKKKMCKKWKDINQLSENWCRSKSAQCALTHKASKQAESVITNNFRASRISKRIIQRGLQHKKYEPNQTKWRADIYVRMPVCECTACVYVWHVTNPQMQSRCFAIIIYDICHPVWNERER